RDTPRRTPKPAATLEQPQNGATGPAGASHQQKPQSRSGTQPDQSGEGLWRSFLEGAGLELTVHYGPSPNLLQEIGEMLKIAVDGIQSLIMTRARAKNELRVEITLIEEHDNNPLKFSPGAQLALERIFAPSARAFLSGPGALREAV